MEKYNIFGLMCFMAVCGIVLMYNLPDYWTSVPLFSQSTLTPPDPARFEEVHLKIEAPKRTTSTSVESETHNMSAADRSSANTEITVAIGCAITSNKLEKKMDFKHSTPEQIRKVFPIFKTMAPSFCKTASAGFSYHFFFAYDSNDVFFSNASNRNLFLNVLNSTVQEICVPRHVQVTAHTSICDHTHKPAWAQNDAMMEAYLHNMDYYYRINDDSLLSSQGWTEVFIKTLKGYDPPNVGVVGPHHQGGNMGILTYDFVHHTHVDMFGYYYPRDFTGKIWVLSSSDCLQFSST